MKKYIYSIFILLLIVLWLTRTYDTPLSLKNPFDNSIRVQVQTVKSIISFSPVIVLQKANGLEKICTVKLNVSYDCAYDVDEDFKSITWLSKDKFQIRVKTDGRVHRTLGKNILVYNINCIEKSHN